MKNIDYKNIKRINSYTNLPKFDIGKRVNQFSSGYQAGEQVDTSQFSSTPTQGFGQQAANIGSQITPLAVTGGLGLLQQGMGIANQVYTGLKGATSSIAGAAASAASNTSGSLLSNVSNITTNVAQKGAEIATKPLASTLGSTLLGAAGAGLNIAGAVTGGIGIANAVKSFKDPVVTSSDALNSMGKSTQSKYGELYTTYTGLDRKGIEDVIDNANTRDKTSLQMNAASTGMSTGALAGSIFGPIGTGLGALLGGLFGWLGGLFGGESAAEKRRKATERMIDNTLYATSNYNMNEEAESASRGMRRIFSQDHAEYADKGKDVNTDFGKPGKIKMVHTSKGIQPGVELGIGGRDETIFNPTTGEASVIEEGKKRVDNISVGTPITSKNAKREWDDTVILGNTVNPETGNLISEDAKPYAKVLENSKKQTPMTNIGKKTQELNERNAIAALQHLADIQQLNHAAEEYKYNCGKLAKYYDGKPMYGNLLPIPKLTPPQKPWYLNPKPWLPKQIEDTESGKFNGIGDYVMTIMPHLGQLGMLLSDNTDYTPKSYNPFVASNYGRYVDNMRSRRLNPAQALKNAELANTQNRYATTHQGGLSAGQITALSSMSNLVTANAKNNILADYAQKNIALANEADRIGVQAAMSEAARQQQGNTNWYEWLMRSGSTAYNLKQAKRKAIYDQLGSIGKDVLAMLQYNQARALQNKKIKLFDKVLDPNVLNQLNNLFR